MAAVAAGMVGGLAGCHAGPLSRSAAREKRPHSLGSVGRAALLPATVTLDQPAELASIDPSNSRVGTTSPSPGGDRAEGRARLASANGAADAEPSAPTPLLDAALARARSRGEVVDPIASPTPSPSAAAAPAIAPADPAVIAAVLPATPPAAEPTAPVVEPPAPATVAAEAAPAPEPAPVAPEEAWREGVRRLVGLTRARLESGGSPAGGEPWGLRARVLAWLAEPDIDPDLGPRDADGVKSVLKVLEAVASPDPRAEARGADVQQALQAVASRAPLEVVELRLCSKVHGIGDFEEFDPPAFWPGREVIIHAEVDGVRYEPAPGGFAHEMAGTMEVTPDDGGPTVSQELLTVRDLRLRRLRDYHCNFRKAIPAGLAPGRYKMNVTLREPGTGRSASRTLAFVVVPAPGADPVGVAATPRDAAPAP